MVPHAWWPPRWVVTAADAAVQAAGFKIPTNEAWTFFAPNNTAFEDPDFLNKTGLTAQQLLQPANKQALTQVTCGTV
jgi:uncharacterized surface protein with fasciclin (FAS1) repeats